MQPQNYYSNNYSAGPYGRLNVHRLVTWLLVAGGLISAWLLLSAWFGYGTIHFKLPAQGVAYVNGHKIDGDSVKLRTGSYTVMVKSPQYETSEQTIRVNMWSTNYQPPLTERKPVAILSSVIGAYGTYGAPGISQVKWFEGHTWLVGVAGPGSATPIALHYVHDTWQIGYYAVGKYPQSLKSLPDDVALYLETMEEAYAG